MTLRIEQLGITFPTPGGAHRAVLDASLEVPAGRTVALVGESGCGKSLTALAVLRLLPPGARIVAGRIRLDGVDVLGLAEREVRAVRGRRVAMVFQEPMTSLNPVLPVGEQLAEVLRGRHGPGGRGVAGQVERLLDEVGLPDAAALRRAYPHELSGGMRQRVLIAMALAGEPEFLMADEPTTALDVTVQAQILSLLRRIQAQRGMGLLLITHDLSVVAQVADDVYVMYAGRIVEHGPTVPVIANPAHPYTQGLLRCVPRLEGGAPIARGNLPAIQGEVPAPGGEVGGCAFHPRCARAQDAAGCMTREPPTIAVGPAHGCACWRIERGSGC